MKNIVLLIAVLGFLVACKKGGDNPDVGNPGGGNIPSSVILRIGDNITYDYDEIHLYDSSSHVLIFKEIHPEFDKLKDATFEACAEGDTVYQGHFWPAYFSSMPIGAYISNNPLFLQNYALKIDFRSSNNNKDLRNDPRFIKSLSDRNLLHSGLAVKISKIESNGSLISFTFTVTNMDNANLLILDPDLVGVNVFHYFTNGLSIKNISTGATTHVTIPPKAPVPLNGFLPTWLSSLSPTTTKSYTFLYSLGSALSPGEYSVTFLYPGLTSQVDIMNLYQKGTRIWLGDLTVTGKMTIQ
jgi:hypothetical protein